MSVEISKKPAGKSSNASAHSDDNNGTDNRARLRMVYLTANTVMRNRSRFLPQPMT